MSEVAIVVHGGAGNWPRDAHEAAHAGLKAAVEAGHAVLAAGGDALAAVEAAVVVLEDDPIFNAGRGAALDERGGVALDAAVMRGADRAAGSVASLRGIRNPVRAARSVLDDGRWLMLVGEPAGVFARDAGLETAAEAWFVTDARRRAYEQRDASRGGTVGAVARDATGATAAATSTGGTARKHPGRVGDSPLIAAGTWADDATAAISCTGDGEAIIRAALAHEVDALMRHAALPLAEAAERALATVRDGTAGLIAVSATDLAAPFTTPAMPRGWCVGDGPVLTAVGRDG
jgi:isoaspartyl peptidase/L-asparaginase-like protein (Ntn-hydrolase superfamily)